MEVAVCGEVVSFGFPIVEGTLYLAVGFLQFSEAEVLCHPCTSGIRSAMAFSLSHSCFSAHRCLMAAISCEVRAACRAAVFYKNEKPALSSSCFNADTQSGTPWGEKPILDGFFDIGDSPSVPCLLNFVGIALGMTLDCDFLRRFFNPKNFANFASEIDPASFEVRLEPSFRKADTLWKSSGFILRGVL